MPKYEDGTSYVVKGETLNDYEERIRKLTPIAGDHITITPGQHGYTIAADCSKSAIVRACGAWIGWFCEERPESIFADVVDVVLEPDPDAPGQLYGQAKWEREFWESVDVDTIRIVSLMPLGGPAHCWVDLVDQVGAGVLAKPARAGREPSAVRLRVEARRHGHNYRWPRFTQAQAIANSIFWAKARKPGLWARTLSWIQNLWKNESM